MQLTAGQTYTLGGPVQQLSWVTPGQIDPDIGQAVAAARRAATAVVVVGDGQESEAADRVNLTLPSDQNQLIDAVAAVNPHTVVVIDAGGPVVMPWLGQVSSVLDAWYPGQTDGTALAATLFGAVDPSGHLPITFPTTTHKTPVSEPTQFPGIGRRGRLLRGRRRRLPLVRRHGHDAAVPLRVRPLLHHVPLRRPHGAGAEPERSA